MPSGRYDAHSGITPSEYPMRTRGTYAKSLWACPHHVLARPEHCAYPGWVLGAMKKLTAMPSQCWICREQVDGLEDALMASLLLHLKLRNGVRGCPSRCEEIQSDSGVICCRFYRLECDHYCANHIDHTCCRCRAMKSPTRAAGDGTRPIVRIC